MGYHTTEQDTRGIAERTASVGKAPQTAALGELCGIICPWWEDGAISNSPQKAIALHLSLPPLLGKRTTWKSLAPRERGEGEKGWGPWEDMSVFEDGADGVPGCLTAAAAQCPGLGRDYRRP